MDMALVEYIYKRLPVLLFFVPIVAIVIIFREAIFFDRMYYNGDTMLQFFPYFNFFAHDTGRIAHSILSGFPLDTTVTGIWYYPVNTLFLLLFDSFDAYKFLILFDLLLTYAFSFLYARKIGLKFETSILTAMVFLFSGQLMLWSTTATNANYFFLLPAVLLTAEYLRAGKGRWLFLPASGVLLGVGWLSGHIQFIVYIHVFFVIYSIVAYRHCRGGGVVNPIVLRETGDCFVAKPSRNDTGVSENSSASKFLPVRYLSRTSFDVLIAFVISFLVGFPQIRTIIGFLGQTSRIQGVSLHEFFSGSFYPQDVIHFLLPFWSNPVIHTGIPSFFIGILSILLLIFGFVIWKRLENPLTRFFLSVFGVCIVMSFMYSPIGLVLYHIPFVNAFREWSRVMFIGNFAAAIAIGFTLEYLVLHGKEVQSSIRKYLRIIRWILYGVFVPVVVLVSILKVFAFERFRSWIHSYVTNAVYPRGAGFPLEHYLNLADQYVNDAFGQLFIGNRHIIVALVTMICSIWLLKRLGANFLRAHAPSPPLVGAAASILIVAFNVVGVYGAYFDAVPRSLLFHAPETARVIQDKAQGQGPYRVYSLFPGISEYNELVIRCGTTEAQEVLQFQKSVLTPNMNMLAGLNSIDAYENYMPLRVSEMLAFVGSERATTGELVARESIPLEERVQKVTNRKNVLRSMNVRFVLSHERIHDPDVEEIAHEKVGKCKTDVFVYELKDPWPRYFITGSYQVMPQEVSNVFEYVSGYLSNHPFSDGIVLEKDPGICRGVIARKPCDEAISGDARISEIDNASASTMTGEKVLREIKKQDIQIVEGEIGKDRMTFRIESQQPSLLFIGNAWLPGWRATINGTPIEILRANYIYMAVPLGQGIQAIELRYSG